MLSDDEEDDLQLYNFNIIEYFSNPYQTEEKYPYPNSTYPLVKASITKDNKEVTLQNEASIKFDVE